MKCFYVLTLLYLRKSAACLAAYSSGEGVVLCFRRSLDGYACRCPVSSVGTVSTSDVALLARLYRQGSGSKSESFFRWSWALVFLDLLTNCRRAGGACVRSSNPVSSFWRVSPPASCYRFADSDVEGCLKSFSSSGPNLPEASPCEA